MHGPHSCVAVFTNIVGNGIYMAAVLNSNNNNFIHYLACFLLAIIMQWHAPAFVWFLVPFTKCTLHSFTELKQ